MDAAVEALTHEGRQPPLPDRRRGGTGQDRLREGGRDRTSAAQAGAVQRRLSLPQPRHRLAEPHEAERTPARLAEPGGQALARAAREAGAARHLLPHLLLHAGHEPAWLEARAEDRADRRARPCRLAAATGRAFPLAPPARGRPGAGGSRRATVVFERISTTRRPTSRAPSRDRFVRRRRSRASRSTPACRIGSRRGRTRSLN